MIELPSLRMVAQRGTHDCAICCLAMFLNVSYEDALEAATGAAVRAHRRGMYTPQILAAAARLGIKLVKRRIPKNGINLLAAEPFGIVNCTIATDGTKLAHTVVARWGLIFEPDGGEIWEPDDYEERFQAVFTEILVRAA